MLGIMDKPKVALITGINRQDGAYLAEFLLSKGYWCTASSAALPCSTPSDRPSLSGPARFDRRLHPHHGDMTDSSSLGPHHEQVQPDEIYNNSPRKASVAVSFEEPEYTANADALGALRLLEAIRILRLKDKTRSTKLRPPSFGLARESPQPRGRRFNPRSPYGVAKLYAY